MVAQSFAVRGLMQSVLTPRSAARMAMTQIRCYQIPQTHMHTFHVASLFTAPSTRGNQGLYCVTVADSTEMEYKHPV